MLKRATEISKNDGYIIDSLGWAYYAKKIMIEAEFFAKSSRIITTRSCYK